MNYNKSFVIISNNETSIDNDNPRYDNTKNIAKDENLGVLSEAEKKELNNNVALIIQNATNEAEKIKKTAHQQGYMDGMDEANKKLAASIQAETQKVLSALSKIEIYKQNMFNELQDNILELSLDIAEKIVNIQLKRDDNLYIGIIKKAVAKLKLAEKFVLRVSQTEYDQYFKQGEKWLLDEIECGSFEVVCDPCMEEKGCVIESDEGIINAGIQVQLNKIKSSLTEKVAQDGQAL